MENKLSVVFYTGVNSVTGANFLLQDSKTKILVDCGLQQGSAESNENNKKDFAYNPSEMDYLFITHAHLDHIGRVCKLVRDGFRGTIYSTPETRELATVMLQDALKVMEMKEREVTDGEKEKPLYDVHDFNQAFLIWKTIPYHEVFKINDDFSVFLKDAGHILGSSMFEFSYHGKKIVFTGDSGNSPTPLLRDTEEIRDATYMIVDSVYGDRNHESKEERDSKFREIVTDTIKAGGALVIPAFSVERTQVILYTLNNLVEEHQIPSVPIFLDSPLGLKVTDIYARTSRHFNTGVQKEIKEGDNIFSFPKLTITHGSRDSHDIFNTKNPKVIIAGSGMSSGGRIVQHEMNYLPDPRSTILLMGYQALGTLGRRIQDKPKEVEIKGTMIPVRARIEMISGYSSHKDSDGIVEMVYDSASTLKKVFVVLGEPKSSMYLAQRLKNELDVEAICPEQGKMYILE